MKNILIIISLIFLVSCSENIKKADFDFFLTEPCIIVNYEQDNTIEGNYLTAEEIQIADSSVKIKLPESFFINKANCSNWILGWGTNHPLFDAGVENIRAITNIDIEKGIFSLGKILRGGGFPAKTQRIVFWNTKPSGFDNVLNKPVIDTKIWPEFAGESINFSNIVFDSTLKKYVIIVNECDTNKIQIYAATSTDLFNWNAVNSGNPILKAIDFKNYKWTGKDKTGKFSQTPFASDIIYYNSKWYLFLDGYNTTGKRNIGLAISESTILGPYKIIEDPVITCGDENEWNSDACFYAKVKKYKDGFIMFYDGRNSKGVEQIGIAKSKDLITWINSTHNPVIDQHTGWRSSEGSTEPNYVEIKNDSIFLMISGAKKLKMDFWSHYISKRMYLDKSGNVNDNQSGVFVSTDGGEGFIAHKNNPVFTNDYSNPFENEHLGGNFQLIKTDTADFIFYQAKSSFVNSKYNILLRIKKI